MEKKKTYRLLVSFTDWERLQLEKLHERLKQIFAKESDVWPISLAFTIKYALSELADDLSIWGKDNARRFLHTLRTRLAHSRRRRRRRRP